MTRERWQRVKDVLSLALKRPAHQRVAALDEACGDDASLRSEIGELLDCRDRMGRFLEEPILGDLPETILEDTLPSEFQQWTRYQMLERLGSGGMAVVYRAWDPRLNRPIAIKVISERDERTVKRFLREAEAQARVDHEHVLKIYETGVVGPHHYIAMQYVNGPTLLGVREETTLEQKVELMLEVAEGLHAAHRQGLVHRDIKPSNILVEHTAEGLKPYLLDFGLAVELGAPALTKTGIVVGTPRYMAPERIQGGTSALDRRSDIYSLGATFYEFISGEAPFGSTSGLQVLVDVLERDFAPLRSLQPALSPELDAVVGKCLEKDPQQRYPSTRALADDLRRYLEGDQVLARPTGTLGRLAKKARKHPRLATAFLGLVTLTVITAAWGASGYWRATRQAALAQQLGQEIRDLDWLFRAAQMSPLHAIEPQKRQVRERMARVEQMTETVGSLAFGPGHYALGCGFLTLGDTTKALHHLELAWESGYRTADTATALGLAHGEIFRVELARAQRIGVDRERAARIGELEAAHRDRALYFLGEGRSSSIVPTRYVDALIASHRGDVPRAIQEADEAARETPWLFEARLLPGHLEFKEAVRLYLSGGVDQAAGKARQADRYYADAQRVAGSSIDAYLGRCAVAGLLLHMRQHGLATAEGLSIYQQAEESCSRALLVEPDNAEAHRLYSEAVRTWGNQKVQAREDPGNAYDRAAALAERAIRLSGGDLEAILALADTFLDRAWWESRSDRDPRRALDQAVATFEKGLAVDPRNFTAANNMGQALLLRARVEAARRLDASASYERAVASFQRALRLDPSLAFGFRNLGRAAVERADEQARRGVDPTPGLEAIVRFIEQVAGDPEMFKRVEAVGALQARLEAARSSLLH